MTDPPYIALAVPRGFEDVACKDILRFVSPQSALFQLDTGFVHLKTNDVSTFSSILEAYDAGKLWSVTRCLVCLRDQPLMIPKDLELRLVAERKSLPSKRSRTRAVLGQEVIRESTPTELERTESEAAYIALLQNDLEALQDGFDRAFKAWRAHARLSEMHEKSSLSFAVRMERRDFLFPTLRSLDIERSLGSSFYGLLERHLHCDDIRVRLENPDLEVTNRPSCITRNSLIGLCRS
jgi:hypothetical protein